jgi:hypothetical protein
MRRFLLFLLLAASGAAAQPVPKDLEPVPDPPAATPFDDPSLEPEITIRERGGEKVEEYRIAGRLYAIRVTPAHGVPYILVDHQGDGNFSRYDGPGEEIAVPMWVIREF